MKNFKLIRTEADYEAALMEIERLWGARAGTLKNYVRTAHATLLSAKNGNDIRHWLASHRAGHPLRQGQGIPFQDSTEVYVIDHMLGAHFPHRQTT